MDSTETVRFVWTPATPGNYQIHIDTDVTDSQCNQNNKVADNAYENLVVLEARPTNECYTIINNLVASNAQPQVGQTVTFSYNRISNYADNNHNLFPVQTRVTETGIVTGTQVFSQQETLAANPDAVTPRPASFTYIPTVPGDHFVTVEGFPTDQRCNGLTITPMSSIISIHVQGPSTPQCSDFIDNDGDGEIDYPADFGCTSPEDNNETNNGPTQCSDGIDNDGDGFIDQDDPDCTGPDDPSEFPDPASVVVLPNPATITVGQTQQFTATGGTSYAWSISQGTAFCTVNQNGLLTGIAAGNCVVQARDIPTNGVGSAQVFVIPVPNQPPVIAGLPDQTLNEDTSRDNAFNLNDFSSDPDNVDSQLNYVLAVTTSNQCGVVVDSGKNVDLTPQNNFNGFCDVTVTVRDPSGLSSSDVFRVIVVPVNDNPNFDPLANPIPDQTWTQGTSRNNAFDLDNFFVDVDGDVLTYTASAADNPNITVVIGSGNVVSFTQDASFFFVERVVFTARDGLGGSAVSNSVVLTVVALPVNQPPVIAGLPDQTLNEDTSRDNAFNLNDFSSDPDNVDSQLNYVLAVTTSNQCGVVVDSGKNVDLTPQNNFNGFCDVTVTVRDPSGLSSSDVFRVIVVPVNDNPNFDPLANPIPDQTWTQGTSRNNAFDLDNFFVDVDGDVLTYTASAADNPNITVVIGSGNVVSFTQAASFFGVERVVFTARDGLGGSAVSNSVVLTVVALPVNQPPVIAGLPDQTLNEDTSRDNAFNLNDFSSDPDNVDSQLNYVLAVTTSNQCGVVVDSGKNVDLTPQNNFNGFCDVTVTVRDPSGLSSSDVFRVIVVPVNDNPNFDPLANPIPDQTWTQGTSRNNAFDL